MLCLVNDQLDSQMIEKGQFRSRPEIFKPEDTFELVLKIFEHQAKLVNSKIIFESSKDLPDPKLLLSWTEQQKDVMGE